MPDEWVTFFTVLAQISGAVLALLFVALQTQVNQWRDAPLRQTAAVRNLIELSAPLVISLFALFPGGIWWLGGIIVGTIGVVTVPLYIAMYIKEKRKDQPKIGGYEKVQLWAGSIALPLIYGTVVAFSIVNTDLGLTIVSWLAVWSLASGIAQTWYLLASKTP
ncbi:hypothetical protein SAMN04488581_3768 [Mycolicibacterium neoaurum]|nr:hypothetical protein SAMN04488581_3768 [Mycolicibacterium neoaurum]